MDRSGTDPIIVKPGIMGAHCENFHLLKLGAGEGLELSKLQC